MDSNNVLMVANTASMIKLFNIRNIKILQSLGYKVYVAANFSQPGTISSEEANKFKEELQKLDVKYFNVLFPRGIGNPIKNYQLKKQLCHIIKEYKIKAVHTHAPLSSIITRRAAHKMRIKCIYTSHGFQFFHGGRLKDWLLFYPIEWFYTHWTDALIVINSDDYKVAKHLPVKNIYHIPGIGADIKKSINLPTKEREHIRNDKRTELRIAKDDFLILSVGELTKRKNHSTVIKAIAKLKNPKIKYIIAGIGPEKHNLLDMIKSLKLDNQVRLLGFRKDIRDLYLAADLNAFISRREGLGMGGLDGVALGLYTIGTANTGIKDYVSEPNNGILIENPLDTDEVSNVIKQIIKNRPITDANEERLMKFDKSNVDRLMKEIYIRELG